MMTPSPSLKSRVNRRGKHSTLWCAIESFHHDYRELPSVLAEVGVPSRGTWAYLKKSDERYQVVGQMYGQIVTFDSPPRKPLLDDHP